MHRWFSNVGSAKRWLVGAGAVGTLAVAIAAGTVTPGGVAIGDVPVAPDEGRIEIVKSVTGDGVRPTNGWTFTVVPNAACASLNSDYTIVVPADGGTVAKYYASNQGPGLAVCTYTVVETPVPGWTVTISPTGPFEVGRDQTVTVNVVNSSPTSTSSTTTSTSTSTTTTAAIAPPAASTTTATTTTLATPPTATTTTTAPPTTTTQRALPSTGSNERLPAILGLVFLLAGGFVLLVRRRWA